MDEHGVVGKHRINRQLGFGGLGARVSNEEEGVCCGGGKGRKEKKLWERCQQLFLMSQSDEISVRATSRAKGKTLGGKKKKMSVENFANMADVK